MASSVSTFLLLLWAAVSQASDPTEPMCYDWGVSREAVSVVEGQAGWLSCPLFSHPSVYNYTSTQSAGHTLFWYRVPEGDDLEQPITYSSRLSKDRERLWLQPASAADAGQYICMLRNKSSCSKITMNLKVQPSEQVLRDCPPLAATQSTQVIIPMHDGKVLDCPDLQDVAKMADSEPTVTWYHMGKGLWCNRKFWSDDLQQVGARLQVYVMLTIYEGVYLCTVSYERKGRSLNFSRSINVTAVNPSVLPKEPSIFHPNSNQIFFVKQDTEVHLTCTALFPYLESGTWDIWWTVDGKTLEKLSDPRFSKINRLVKNYHGDRTEESVLVIQNFQSEDLQKEYNCSVRNARGFSTQRARLQEEVSLPSVALGCGLGVTLVLMLILFVVYHVFWLELLLLYRSWFGTDERHTDHKEYDVYISYARNSEDEHFVLSTLRCVLENQLGFSVCIFDRDSLPGGTITDETLSFVARSRRLLVVLSPGYASQGSQALLELKAGIDGMARGGHLRVILVQYRPLQRKSWVKELRRARVALALVQWQGDKSKKLTSRFWKRLRVELPVRRENGKSRKDDAALLRMYSQNSTHSQTGLLTSATKCPEMMFSSVV